MATFALNNCDVDAYQWLSSSTVEWASTGMIPTCAFSPAYNNIWLIVNKDYAHPIDQSGIPISIRICVHHSRGMTGPTDRPYCLWSDKRRIKMNESDNCLLYAYQLGSHEIYVLPVDRQEQRQIQYSPNAVSSNDLPSIDSSKRLGPTVTPKHGALTLDLRIETAGKSKPTRDYC